jgi:hypothetical protein
MFADAGTEVCEGGPLTYLFCKNHLRFRAWIVGTRRKVELPLPDPLEPFGRALMFFVWRGCEEES